MLNLRSVESPANADISCVESQANWIADLLSATQFNCYRAAIPLNPTDFGYSPPVPRFVREPSDSMPNTPISPVAEFSVKMNLPSTLTVMSRLVLP
jgi:hypothetical protein